MRKFLSVIAVFFILFMTSGIAEAKKTVLKWGATNVRSGLYANTAAMARIVNRAYPGEIEIRTVETGGYIDNLSRIQKMSINLGPADAAAAYANYEGIIDFKGKQNSALRALWGGYITPIHIITSKRSGADTIQKIHGIRFAMNPGTTSGRAIEMFFDANGIKPDYKMMSIPASEEAMITRVVDGWFKAGFKDFSIVNIAATMEINVLPVEQRMIDKMNEKYPGQAKSMMIPARLFTPVKNEQLSFAYVVSDFVHKDVPDDIVYKIVKAVWESRKELLRTLPTLREGNFDDMLGNADKYLQVPLHAGAVKFYQEVLRVKVPDKLLPPEMKKR